MISVPRVVDIALDTGDSFAQVALGSSFSCARSVAGRAVCWGSNLHGALGVNATGANLPNADQEKVGACEVPAARIGRMHGA